MKQEMRKAISTELKVLRTEYGLSQIELSEKSKVSSSSITKYEQGIKDMKLNLIEQIIKAYGIDLYIFFDRILTKTYKKEN